jgi:hypothetical protein
MERLKGAATGLVNLGVAGAAAAGAAALQSWPLLAVGAVTYSALVAWDLVRKGAGEGGGGRAALRDPGAYKDPQARASVAAVVAARGEIERVLVDTPAEVQASLAVAIDMVGALVERAAGLADRCEDLSSYLATKDPREVRRDVDSIRARIEQTSDAEARAQYQAALASREDHLRSLEELGNARERVVASLLSITSSLEGLPAKMVHMRVLDAAAMDKLGGDVNGELERVNDEMKSFEETLRTLGEARA